MRTVGRRTRAVANRGSTRRGGATSKGQVRIIGGERRGHRLQFVDQGGNLRPSSDRMRETLFNWLQFELPGLRVLDLFAGSGVLGAEALSRGAQRAVLVEKKRERAADLKRQLLPLFDDRIHIHNADAMQWLASSALQFDLVFVDPPYDGPGGTGLCRAGISRVAGGQGLGLCGKPASRRGACGAGKLAAVSGEKWGRYFCPFVSSSDSLIPIRRFLTG